MYLLLFLEGLASFISPCVLPMLPLYLSYLTAKDDNKVVKNSIGFILGFTITFVILGLLSSTIGIYLTSYMDYIKIVFGLFIVLLGLNYMNLIKLPFINKESKIDFKFKNKNFFEALLFGLVFSITWTPCVGVFLGTALMQVMEKGDIILGMISLLVYSLGLAIPFIISAIFIKKLNNFEFIKKHYNIIINISGIILIVFGFYMILK
jgi:cytochrome c-type biogenesis protein